MRGIKDVSEEPTTGHGRAARTSMRHLVGRGVPLAWTPVVPGRYWGAWLEPFAGQRYTDPVLGPPAHRPIDSDLVIVPLRAGGGTRVKILEAFARHAPDPLDALG